MGNLCGSESKPRGLAGKSRVVPEPGSARKPSSKTKSPSVKRVQITEPGEELRTGKNAEATDRNSKPSDKFQEANKETRKSSASTSLVVDSQASNILHIPGAEAIPQDPSTSSAKEQTSPAAQAGETKEDHAWQKLQQDYSSAKPVNASIIVAGAVAGQETLIQSGTAITSEVIVHAEAIEEATPQKTTGNGSAAVPLEGARSLQIPGPQGQHAGSLAANASPAATSEAGIERLVLEDEARLGLGMERQGSSVPAFVSMDGGMAMSAVDDDGLHPPPDATALSSTITTFLTTAPAATGTAAATAAQFLDPPADLSIMKENVASATVRGATAHEASSAPTSGDYPAQTAAPMHDGDGAAEGAAKHHEGAEVVADPAAIVVVLAAPAEKKKSTEEEEEELVLKMETGPSLANLQTNAVEPDYLET